jgi:hypothetical protein
LFGKGGGFVRFCCGTKLGIMVVIGGGCGCLIFGKICGWKINERERDKVVVVLVSECDF